MCRGLFLLYALRGMGPKADNIYTVGWGRYRWYQSHVLAGSVGPTREDACARKGGWIVVTQKGLLQSMESHIV